MNISKNKWYSFFLFKNSLPYLLLIISCLIFSAVLGARTPFLIAGLSKNYDNNYIYFPFLEKLFYNFLFVYINRVGYQLLVNKYVRLLIQHSRLSTYSKWLWARDLDSEKYPQGEILSRIMSDTEAIRDLISSGAFGIFIDLSFVVSCLYGFIKLHLMSGLYISGAELLATILLIWGSTLMRDMFMKLRNSQARVNRVTANVIGGFSQIYYTRHSDYAMKKSTVIFDDFLENQNKANSMDAFYYAIAESLYPILLSLVVFIYPYSHIVEAALIFAIVDLIQRSISPIKEISGKIANIQRAKTGVDRIIHFLNDIIIPTEQSLLNSRVHQEDFLKLKVDIDSFKYKPRNKEAALLEQNEFKLTDIHFEGLPGQLIGIVGLSGSGKSTLLNILSGNLDAPSANIELSFKAKNLFSKDWLEYQKEVSLVSQESHIFSETLMFNITMSNIIDPKFEEKYQFFIDQIPYLGKMGLGPNDLVLPQKLSLGQKQLLAGIRALYLNKNVVFFDEISSALDPELEFSLRQLVLLIQQKSLTIIVAHRVETIVNSDLILVMDKGRVVNSGKHSELLIESKVYCEFIEELSHS
jgi:ABC-type multidrug transport system fused ATPase/permease subunit